MSVHTIHTYMIKRDNSRHSERSINCNSELSKSLSMINFRKTVDFHQNQLFRDLLVWALETWEYMWQQKWPSLVVPFQSPFKVLSPGDLGLVITNESDDRRRQYHQTLGGKEFAMFD